MTNRFRLNALLAGLLCAALAPLPAGAAESYLVQGLPFFAPYRLAVATLDISGDKVSGTLAPPVGDPRPALPLSGSVTDGKLSLAIGSGTDAVTLVFSEDERDPYRLWEEVSPVADLPAVVLFRPGEGFSGAALAVQHADANWCGRFLGGLSVELRADALKASREAPAPLAGLDVALSSRAEEATGKLSTVWPRLRLAAMAGTDVIIDVAVPVGSEAKTAEELRRLPQVMAVDLPTSCGEMARVAIPRETLMDGDKVSEAKLKAFADAILPRYLSGAKADASVPGTRKFKLEDAKVVRGPDGLLRYEAKLTGDAEATRLGSGEVDAFTLTLMPVETVADTAQSISLVPQVKDMKVARRSGSGALSGSAFKAEDDEAVPVAVIHRLVTWLGAVEDTDCAFLTETAFEEPDEALSCSNITLDNPGDEGGGD